MASIFDILGPVMVGPSSSHTAGAVRIGLVGRQLLGAQPVKATVYFHGSFAATGRGHGTDRAQVFWECSRMISGSRTASKSRKKKEWTL